MNAQHFCVANCESFVRIRVLRILFWRQWKDDAPRQERLSASGTLFEGLCFDGCQLIVAQKLADHPQTQHREQISAFEVQIFIRGVASTGLASLPIVCMACLYPRPLADKHVRFRGESSFSAGPILAARILDDEDFPLKDVNLGGLRSLYSCRCKSGWWSLACLFSRRTPGSLPPTPRLVGCDSSCCHTADNFK